MEYFELARLTYQLLSCTYELNSPCSKLVAAVCDGGEVLNIGRSTRAVPPAIQRALRLRDGVCQFPGCACQRHLDAHPIQHWADGDRDLKVKARYGLYYLQSQRHPMHNSTRDQSDKATEKVLERIRKLYAMSKENGASPHEAEIALRRCQALMERYGVAESDLETSEFDSVLAFSIRKKMPTYITILAGSAALLHDCLVIRRATSIEFRGYAIDTQVAQLTFEYLDESLTRQLQQAKKNGIIEAGRSAAHDFRIGFALQIHQRCKDIDSERRASANKSVSTGNALVVRKLAMVNENCAKGIGKAKPKHVLYRDNTANSAGREAGKDLSLNTQVSSTPEAT